MQKIKVLVFPCGSEVGLEVNRSLKDISFVDLYGGSSVSDHGEWAYEKYIGNLPYISDDEFVLKLNKCLDKYNIDYIFPALDSVVLKLSETRTLLHAKVITSSEDAVTICRSKKKTYDALAGTKFLPKIFDSIENVDSYPVFLKPAIGQGGKGATIIKNANELQYELKNRSEAQVICEYLPGMEYTVDCFTDRHGTLKYYAQRSRRRVRNGISVNSVLVKTAQQVCDIAHQINKKMSFQGAWFFQVKLSLTGEYKLMEVATRVAGTMCVQRARGVNLPLLSIFDAMGYDVDIRPQFDVIETDRALENSFEINYKFDEVYIDYDDTIIVHNKVNCYAIAFIYKCINDNIPVFLITKHTNDIKDELRRRKLSEYMFSKIIHISQSQSKINHINPSINAIFVDDSFAERVKIEKHFKIKTVGVDFLEILLNIKNKSNTLSSDCLT